MEDIEKQYWISFSHPETDHDQLLPLNEQIRRFEEKIGLHINPEDVAMEQHKARLAALGIEWDDTPVDDDLAGDPYADAGLDIDYG